jgi:iron complex transport system ATP-binding protein
MSPRTSAPPLLDLHRVNVMRGGKVVLRDFTLKIEVGEHVSILGPNGCGKSTFIKTVTRECYPLARPESSVRIFGQDTWNVFELRNLLGIVSYDLAAACTRDITGLEVVVSGFFSSIGTWPHQHVTSEMRDRSAAVLDRLRAGYLADRLLTEMSSGEMRRVLIGRALVHQPKALLFDEPSNSLDLFAQHELREIMSELARTGTAILLVTHHLSDIIPEIERVVLIRAGRVVADGPKEQILQQSTLSELFGLPVNLVRRDGYYHCW